MSVMVNFNTVVICISIERFLHGLASLSTRSLRVNISLTYELP